MNKPILSPNKTSLDAKTKENSFNDEKDYSLKEQTSSLFSAFLQEKNKV